jgi:hypothetical protein
LTGGNEGASIENVVNIRPALAWLAVAVLARPLLSADNPGTPGRRDDRDQLEDLQRLRPPQAGRRGDPQGA